MIMTDFCDGGDLRSKLSSFEGGNRYLWRESACQILLQVDMPPFAQKECTVWKHAFSGRGKCPHIIFKSSTMYLRKENQNLCLPTSR